ncbi:MAG TPA: hypothetical protein DHM90_08325 [Clostridiaceae bacterium]|nr:hypothetical protein [Clostridiaceae bacterium]
MLILLPEIHVFFVPLHLTSNRFSFSKEYGDFEKGEQQIFGYGIVILANMFKDLCCGQQDIYLRTGK